MSNTPLPAPVHFIQNVHHLPVLSKVRVLGWNSIQSYDVFSGIVVLYHRPSIDIPLPRYIGQRNSTSRSKSRSRAVVNNTGQANGYTTTDSVTEPTYTLNVSIDLLLQKSPDNTKDPLPPLIEGAWFNVIGYKNTTGGLDAITMYKAVGKLDLEGYEKAVLGMIRIREDVEREVVKGTAKGIGVEGVNWGY